MRANVLRARAIPVRAFSRANKKIHASAKISLFLTIKENFFNVRVRLTFFDLTKISYVHGRFVSDQRFLYKM